MVRLLLILCVFALPLRADPPPQISCSDGVDAPRHCIRAAHFAEDVCTQIDAEARQHGLPPAFFARLLWQESRFDPNAVSPANAKGIAQFIDSTARLRKLSDPFNPAEAIARSAEYLGEMTRRYGSLGMAAIGYNGGERRAEGWQARTGGLARETIDYVRIITGHTAETWRDAPPEDADFALDGETPFLTACVAMAAKRRVTPLRPSQPPPPRFSPWGVQVAYGLNATAARAAYDRLSRACRRAAPATRLELVPQARRGTRTSILAVRIGADSRREAMRLCGAISDAGCSCRAYRN
ncbi:glycosyl transferase [Jannaschia pagri]|uniref:Glycosyl transferase n=1 Tax=Jannaschia pagri TaxID=2829797 RepID=A0ABQ4NKT7_9RHOB|nr:MULTISPECIES: lytic transglycosylase domain-containing protein [unclassified Jannaschia]GIT90876.1 glycosyl transferase [Jannaschia sp. AI_61]GIT94707.1 glycosyl transferase [Jannaschia sp. AI_62]